MGARRKEQMANVKPRLDLKDLVDRNLSERGPLTLPRKPLTRTPTPRYFSHFWDGSNRESPYMSPSPAWRRSQPASPRQAATSVLDPRFSKPRPRILESLGDQTRHNMMSNTCGNGGGGFHGSSGGGDNFYDAPGNMPVDELRDRVVSLLVTEDLEDPEPQEGIGALSSIVVVP